MATNQDPEAAARTITTALVEGLRINDRVLNDKCSSALCAFGVRVTSWLIQFAESNRTGDKHRDRLLHTISRIREGAQTAGNIVASVVEALSGLFTY